MDFRVDFNTAVVEACRRMELNPFQSRHRIAHKEVFASFYLPSKSNQTIVKMLPEAEASVGKEHNPHLSIEIYLTN